MSDLARLNTTEVTHRWSGYSLIVGRRFTSLWLDNEGGPKVAINLDENRGAAGPDEFRLQLVQLDQLPIEDGTIKVFCDHALTYAYLPAALFWPLVQAVATRPEGSVRVSLEPDQTALMVQMQPIFRCSATVVVGRPDAATVPWVYFVAPQIDPVEIVKPRFETFPKKRPV